MSENQCTGEPTVSRQELLGLGRDVLQGILGQLVRGASEENAWALEQPVGSFVFSAAMSPSTRIIPSKHSKVGHIGAQYLELGFVHDAAKEDALGMGEEVLLLPPEAALPRFAEINPMLIRMEYKLTCKNGVVGRLCFPIEHLQGGLDQAVAVHANQALGMWRRGGESVGGVTESLQEKEILYAPKLSIEPGSLAVISSATPELFLRRLQKWRCDNGGGFHGSSEISSSNPASVSRTASQEENRIIRLGEAIEAELARRGLPIY